MFAEDAELCGTGGCPYYGLCLKDPNRGFYECHCQGCTPGDPNDDPVCGDDEVTYANQCELESESCRNQRPIKRTHKGKCKKGKKTGMRPMQCDTNRLTPTYSDENGIISIFVMMHFEDEKTNTSRLIPACLLVYYRKFISSEMVFEWGQRSSHKKKPTINLTLGVSGAESISHHKPLLL